MDPVHASAAEISRAVIAKEISALEIAEAMIPHVAAADAQLGAYLTLTPDLMRDSARKVDARIAAGEKPLLAGVPTAIKDNMALLGTPTTCASKILEHWIAPYTGTAVQRLLDAGILPIGKTNMDEFAMGSSGENSALGTTKNPYDLDRVPGGSSAGSAAAVGGYVATLSTGSDTGGSIREPAAFCNVVGFKPTYGRVSRYGFRATRSRWASPTRSRSTSPSRSWTRSAAEMHVPTELMTAVVAEPVTAPGPVSAADGPDSPATVPAQSPDDPATGESAVDGLAAVDLPLLEALLLSTHHPLIAGRLAELLELEGTKPIRAAVAALNDVYEHTDRSFRIEQVAGGYQILTLPRFGDALRRLHQKEIDAKLTKAAVETLAIIAYKQPILRADVEAIRGVASGETIRSLMEKHLVKIAGRAELPRPADPVRDHQTVPGAVRTEHPAGPAAVAEPDARGWSRGGGSREIRRPARGAVRGPARSAPPSPEPGLAVLDDRLRGERRRERGDAVEQLDGGADGHELEQVAVLVGRGS